MRAPGTRIQLHPVEDRWMMGDCYGEIVRYLSKGPRKGWPVVLLDKSGKTMTFHPDNILSLRS